MRSTQVPSGMTAGFGVNVSKYFDLVSSLHVTPGWTPFKRVWNVQSLLLPPVAIHNCLTDDHLH